MVALFSSFRPGLQPTQAMDAGFHARLFLQFLGATFIDPCIAHPKIQLLASILLHCICTNKCTLVDTLLIKLEPIFGFMSLVYYISGVSLANDRWSGRVPSLLDRNRLLYSFIRSALLWLPLLQLNKRASNLNWLVGASGGFSPPPGDCSGYMRIADSFCTKILLTTQQPSLSH